MSRPTTLLAAIVIAVSGTIVAASPIAVDSAASATVSVTTCGTNAGCASGCSTRTLKPSQCYPTSNNLSPNGGGSIRYSCDFTAQKVTIEEFPYAYGCSDYNNVMTSTAAFDSCSGDLYGKYGYYSCADGTSEAEVPAN